MKKLPENLNCIVTCENVEEVINFELFFDIIYSIPNPSNYFKCYRITDSNHTYGWKQDLSYYKGSSEYSNYEFLTFKEFKAKYLEEFVLPEKWIIKPLKHEFEVVNNWAMNKANKDYSGYIWHEGVSYTQDGVYKPYEKATITFDQFQEYVMKKEERKIIGYITPMDLYGGYVKKGTIYVRATNDHNWYIPEEEYRKLQSSSSQMMPKEIVQQWKAVYEQQEYKGVVKGSNKSLDYIIREQGFVECDNKKVSIDNLKSFLLTSTLMTSPLLPWVSTTISWQIGCLDNVTKEELNDIVAQHNKLFNL